MSALALRRQRLIQQRSQANLMRNRKARKSTFLLNVTIPGQTNHKKNGEKNAFDKVLSGLNSFLQTEEKAELVNPKTTTKYLDSPKSPSSPFFERRKRKHAIEAL